MRKPLRALVRRLRRQFPLLLPARVYVRDRAPDNAFATCELRHDRSGKPSHFVIIIRRCAKGVDGGHLEILHVLHEWAHALAWSIDPKVPDHPDDWGIQFARLYRRILEE